MKVIGCMSVCLRAEVALPIIPWHRPLEIKQQSPPPHPTPVQTRLLPEHVCVCVCLALYLSTSLTT